MGDKTQKRALFCAAHKLSKHVNVSPPNPHSAPAHTSASRRCGFSRLFMTLRAAGAGQVKRPRCGTAGCDGIARYGESKAAGRSLCHAHRQPHHLDLTNPTCAARSVPPLPCTQSPP